MIAQYKKSESMVIVCRYTGIQAKIDLPKVGNLTLEYTHPLSHIDSALDASYRQDFLRQLDSPVLAGILITMLRHTKLLAQSKDHASAINAQLSKASRGHLIKSIELVRRHFVGLPKTSFLPKVVFDYYETQAEANRALESTIGTLVGELLDKNSLVEQVRNYFRAHTKATTFEGYTQQIALEQAREADEIKRAAQQAELDRKAEAALRKAEEERKAKEGMLTRRQRAQKLRTIVQSVNHKLDAKQFRVLTQASKQADLLPEAQLTKLQSRITELLEEHTDHFTREVLLAAQAIFTHCLKVLSQSAFSVEDELLGLDTVHGKAEEVEEEPVVAEPVASAPVTEAKPGSSLLERIRAKRAAQTK